MIPLTITMTDRDNVAIVANDGGLPAGTKLPSGLTLREHVPQGHKVALVDLPNNSPVIRYGIPIGYAAQDIQAGSWVSEHILKMPDARELDNLPIATVKPAPNSPPCFVGAASLARTPATPWPATCLGQAWRVVGTGVGSTRSPPRPGA